MKFENEAVAAVMNRHYTNIKVDREEWPDIDQIYMAALAAMGEQGGRAVVLGRDLFSANRPLRPTRFRRRPERHRQGLAGTEREH